MKGRKESLPASTVDLSDSEEEQGYDEMNSCQYFEMLNGTKRNMIDEEKGLRNI